MYNLSDYVDYQSNKNLLTDPKQNVLAYSREKGYYFTQAGLLTDKERIVGIESKNKGE